MLPPTEGRHSLTGAIAKIVVGGVLMVIIRAFRTASGVELGWDPEAFLSGAFLGLTLVASDYARSGAERRLPPTSAIGLGGGTLALIIMVIAMIPHPAGDPRWGMVAATCLTLPSLYLIVAGVRHARLT